MRRIHSHYENLKVSRDAPIEVIHAAFNALKDKYKTDPDTGQSSRVIGVISRSYGVLSDSAKRAEHDQWIASREQPPSRLHGEEEHLIKRFSWIGALVVAMVIAGVFVSSKTAHPAAVSINLSAPKPTTIDLDSLNTKESTAPNQAIQKPQIATAIQTPLEHAVRMEQQTPPKSFAPNEVPRERYSRPALAPNGQPWPTKSAYVGPTGNEDGYSRATIDNTQNGSDVLVKLCAHQRECPNPIRVFLLRAHEKFVMERVTAGNYDIRYRNLSSGVISESEPFRLEESYSDIQKADGVYRTIKGTTFDLTLYEVLNGNTQSHIIPPEEF